MRVVLELEDLRTLLSRQLGKELTIEQLTVRTDPNFELEIAGMSGMLETRRNTTSAVPPAVVDDDVTLSSARPSDAGGMKMQDLLEYSRDIENELRVTRRR